MATLKIYFDNELIEATNVTICLNELEGHSHSEVRISTNYSGDKMIIKATDMNVEELSMSEAHKNMKLKLKES